jgi:uncharacterized protein
VRIFSKQIPVMAREIVKTLMDAGDIEVETSALEEARKDFASVLNEMVRQERELSDLAINVLATRGWSSDHYAEARKIAAEVRKVPQGEDAIEFIVNQMIETMLHSVNVAEVFAEDHTLRKRVVEVIRRFQKQDEEIETEVRKRLKNIEEGSREWEVAFRKTEEEVRRSRGLI